jgi:DNA-binding NarL/FixJ family response regulator
MLREILVVSDRSVEKHTGNIFSKLGLAPSDADHRRVLAVLRTRAATLCVVAA